MSRRGASIRKYDPAKNQSNDEEGGLAKEGPYLESQNMLWLRIDELESSNLGWHTTASRSYQQASHQVDRLSFAR
jgi:hypothetical protein